MARSDKCPCSSQDNCEQLSYSRSCQIDQIGYNTAVCRGVAQFGLARTVRVREVRGSNPRAPTRIILQGERVGISMLRGKALPRGVDISLSAIRSIRTPNPLIAHPRLDISFPPACMLMDDRPAGAFLPQPGFWRDPSW